jgi:hypothetical protein
MTYLTYGPAPTSHYRVVCAPGDSPLASPLARTATITVLRHRAASASRALLRFGLCIALFAAAASAALGVRLAAFAFGRWGGLF